MSWSSGFANLEKQSIFTGIVDHTAHVLYRLEIWPNREIALKQMIKFIQVPPYYLKLV